MKNHSATRNMPPYPLWLIPYFSLIRCIPFSFSSDIVTVGPTHNPSPTPLNEGGGSVIVEEALMDFNPIVCFINP